MKLFGLIEQMEIGLILAYTVPINHPALFEKVEQYGPGLSVGLELTSANPKKTIKGVTFMTPKVHTDLSDYFTKKGNIINFLGSEEHDASVAAMGKELVKAKKLFEDETDPKKERDLLVRLDECASDFEYASKLGKEPAMLENIAKYKPDIVFLGLAHASRFYRNQQQLKEKYGITIDEYWEDEMSREPTRDDLLFAMGASSEDTPTEAYLEGTAEVRLKKIHSIEEAFNDPDSMRIERTRKAIKEKRVTDGKPDYIGTWDTRMEHRGLFEVFVQERVTEGKKTRIRGTIEDGNGSATFEGETEGDYIEFTKVYKQGAAWMAAKGNIFYSAYSKGDKDYAGDYIGMDCGRGKFTMKGLKT